ncbi:hypothetical protein [Parafrigoribacterium humi]|uniref:hypothetical protein n=1 Tax=Parafrigoribacterium humi TaxID=3144664 RepID=UPI0032EE7374
MPAPEVSVRLIPALEVEPECLGIEIEANIDGEAYVIGFPVPDGRPNSAVFLPHPSAAASLQSLPWDPRDPWACTHRMTHDDRVISMAIHKIVIVWNPTGPSRHEMNVAGARFGHAFDQWYSRLYSWLELWTTQGLNQHQWPSTGIRTQGRGEFEPGQHYGWGNWGVLHEHRGDGTSGPYASSDLLRAAADFANRRQSPSLSWDMLRRARGLPWTNGRQKVIDAATAAEVAVERALFRFFSNHHLSTDQIEATLRPFTGIAEKLRLMEKLVPPSSRSLVSRVADKIAGPRNKAAHAGWTPAPAEVDDCLATVAEVLAEYDPLPTP